MSISRATLLAALLVLAVSGQVSLVSAQDAEGLNVTDAPKILFSTAGFLNVVPEDDWEAFQVGSLLLSAYHSCFAHSPSIDQPFLTNRHAPINRMSAG